MRKLTILLLVTVLGLLSACTVEQNMYTIQFEVNGGEAIEDYEYTEGDFLEVFENPTKEGYSFLNWYYDSECTEQFSLKDDITRSMILYAKWETTYYAVTFEYNNGDHFIDYVGFGETIDEPDTPTKARSEFDGWYTDAQFVNDFDFNTPIYENIVIYTKWTESEKILIGANIHSYNDNFMNGLVRPELERYAEELGVELDVVDSEGNQAKLNDQVDVFIDNGVDVLAINLVDPAAAKTIIDKAKAANIPLILFNKEPTQYGVMDTYDKVWYVGTDSAEAGIIQGEMMVADWKANTDWDLNADGVLDYVLLKGEPGHPDAEARTYESVKAFEDAGITVNELALAASPTWSTADAKNTMDAWLTSAFANQIELVICNNDGMAFGAFQALEAASFDLPVYGVDALDQALTMIGDAELNGTVLNDGVNQARATIDLAINAAEGNEIVAGTDWVIMTDGTKAVRVAYVAVTALNYSDFQ